MDVQIQAEPFSEKDIRKMMSVVRCQLICSVPTVAEMFMYKIHILVIRYT